MTAMQEFVVPKSMPNTFAIKIFLFESFGVSLCKGGAKVSKFLKRQCFQGENGVLVRMESSRNCATATRIVWLWHKLMAQIDFEF
jgi:hypothetical protein